MPDSVYLKQITFKLTPYTVTLINKNQAVPIHPFPVDIMLPPSSFQVHLCYQFGAREVTKFSYPNATGETAGWGGNATTHGCSEGYIIRGRPC